MRRLALLFVLLSPGAAAAAADGILGAAAPEPSLDAVVGDLPFEPYHEANRIVINLAPAGQTPFRLILDTGAADRVLTPRWARQRGVSVRRMKSSPYRKKTRLGRDLQFWVDTRRGDIASSAGWEYGLLAGSFLDDYVIEGDVRIDRLLPAAADSDE